jgi:site-specific recombinase XerD
MPQATFVLKNPSLEKENKNNPTLIYLFFTFNKNRLKYSTGQKVPPKYWNFEKQRVKVVSAFRQAESINMLLESLENDVSNCHRTLLLEGITPTPEHLRVRLNEALKKEDSTTKDLADFAERVVDASNRKEGTKRAIKQVIRVLREFKEAKGKSLHFDSIDLDFYDAYVDYLKEQGYSQNSMGNHIKNIKVFMREAFERSLTKNTFFRSKKFKRLEEESTSIYLSKKELETLIKLDLSEKPRLDRVRDLFIVGCYTGLRFSDLTQLKIENINKQKKVIRVRTQKTDETVIIPIKKVVGEIIDKYEGHLPIAISNEKMNEYLKDLGKEAKLTDKVEIIWTKGGERQREVFQKHDLITVHTARRSFATNGYLEGVPTISLMKITGHKTEKSFLKYIKISQEDNANKLIDHPFFN